MNSTLKYFFIIFFSLVLGVLASYTSVEYQQEKIENICLQTKYCPNDYGKINHGGFPIAFTDRADINSPANYADFEDGWDDLLFAANSSIYFVLFFLVIYFLSKSNEKVRKIAFIVLGILLITGTFSTRTFKSITEWQMGEVIIYNTTTILAVLGGAYLIYRGLKKQTSLKP